MFLDLMLFDTRKILAGALVNTQTTCVLQGYVDMLVKLLLFQHKLLKMAML